MAATAALDRSGDVLLCILSILPFTDLRSISMVNKHIRSLAEPFLYSTIETTWASDSASPAMLLLRSILDRPELSSYIRNLRLVGSGFKDHLLIEEPPAFPLPTRSITKASKTILSTGVPFTKLWIDELQSGAVDAVVATLLITTPKLISLYLGPNFTVRSHLLGKMLLYALGDTSEEYQLPTFASLRDVTYCRRAKEYLHLHLNNAADVLPFFYLSNIQCLSISVDNPAKFVWPTYTPNPSSLRSLEIYRLRETRLSPLLVPLKRLQKLHWHWFYQPDLDQNISTGTLELDTIALTLNQVRDSLTDLTIEAEASPAILAGEYDVSPLEIRGSLDGIVHLVKLRKLCVPWVFLMGFSEASARNLWDPLSRSLEVLTLTADLSDNEEWEWDDDSIVSVIKSELEGWTLPVPASLRRIILPIPLSYSEITDERIQELGYISANAGLSLGWTLSKGG